jgi:DNA-binding response OmpR family regulator
MRVLIIDDDAAYLSACRVVLAEDGHDVITSTSFTDGRRWLAEYNFDALIADVRLGAYNGLHLITLAAPSTIKIAMSAFADTVIRRDAEEAGARFVLKPSDSASLSALLPAAGAASAGQ